MIMERLFITLLIVGVASFMSYALLSREYNSADDIAYYNNTLRVSAYDNFKIYAGATRGGGLLLWGNTTKGTPFVAGNRKDLSLKNSYTMSWSNYNGGIDNFMYLINQI